MHAITRQIRSSIIASAPADLQQRKQQLQKAQKYFPEGFKAYTGVKKTQIGSFVSKALRDYSHPVAFQTKIQIAEELFTSRMYEECQAAILLLQREKKQFDEEIVKVFSRWLDEYVENWAVNDSFCLALLVHIFRTKRNLLHLLGKEWALSDNRWKRRSACIVMLKVEPTDLTRVFSLCDLLLDDGERIVQKGVGWLLKEVARTFPAEVIDFINNHRDRVSGVVRSEVVQALTHEQRPRLAR